jgi:hypothetical protein
MAFIVNKITNGLTNATGSLIGRENLTNIANSLNKSYVSDSKYRPFIKHGNVIQLVSRNSLRPIQIVRSIHNPTQLIITADGQVGESFINSHFTIMVNNRNQHLAFQNSNNYIGLSPNRLLGVLTIDDQKLLSYKTKKNLINNIEFRLHEIFGSEEYFCLESTYSPGNYLSVAPDNSIVFVKNKTEKSAHFRLHLIHNAYIATPTGQILTPVASGAAAVASSAPPYVAEDPDSSDYSKEEEANRNDAASAPVVEPAASSSMNDAPPVYNSLYPQLPK